MAALNLNMATVNLNMATVNLKHDFYFHATRETTFPARSTAPEAMAEQHYSQASDVWSYGMVLFPP
jgi:hypothetical protein